MQDIFDLMKQEKNALMSGAYLKLGQILDHKEAILQQRPQTIDPTAAQAIGTHTRQMGHLMTSIMRAIKTKQELEKLRRYIVTYNRAGQKVEIAIV